MRRFSIVCLVFVLAMTFGFANAYAASSKVTARCAGIAVVQEQLATDAGNPDGWSTIFTADIKTSEKKDLFVDVSLECGLTTNTTVISRQLEKALANAEASVMVKVLVDGIEAAPGEVTFAKRMQELTAYFAGDISDALSIEDGALVIDPTLIESEELQLILDTMTANSFNFIAPNVSVGVHMIEVQAKVSYSTRTETTDLTEAAAAATAYIGKGSVTVESVGMIKDEDINEPPSI